MDRTEHASPTGHRRSLHPAATAGIIAVVLLSGAAFAACSGAHDPAAQTGTAMPTMSGHVPTVDAAPQMTDSGSAAMGVGDLVPADASEAWASRPAYTRGNAQTEEAYAYALYYPQIVQWMPCYCGCGGMGHRSNLDCYYKPAVPGQPTAFEEHASYCDICVKTTLLTKQLVSEGKSLREIRAAVDRTFGGSAPGTPTELPPA